MSPRKGCPAKRYGFQSGITPRRHHSAANLYVGYRKFARSPPPAGIHAPPKSMRQKKLTVAMPRAPIASTSRQASKSRRRDHAINNAAPQTSAANSKIIRSPQSEKPVFPEEEKANFCS